MHKDGIIIFHGKQNNIDEHLNARDIFVLPSYYREGLPRTTLEACACGNPIITTDSVGCRESVKEGENGFLNVVNNTGLLGRWQVLNSSPKVVCDAAHNSHGLKIVLNQIKNEEFGKTTYRITTTKKQIYKIT